MLFHPFDLNGKRTKQVPLDTWVRAEERQTWNPGKKTGPGFVSGWHVVMSRKEAVKYFGKFKNTDDIKICQVFVKGLRPKPRSKITLARWMMVLKNDWEDVIVG